MLEVILNNLKNGNISINDAVTEINTLKNNGMDFVNIDYSRKSRTGYPEVIFCQGKNCEQTLSIVKSMLNSDPNGTILGTRANVQTLQMIAEQYPSFIINETAHIFFFNPYKTAIGNIAVVSGGTSDTGIAEEAAYVAEIFGNKVARFYDVGVAGIHRLFRSLDEIKKANVIIAVAGMEGALPGVIAGLVEVPVIALPTSVGYGTSFGGISALLTMLNSCSPGVSVVNIDNGFGAGYIASLINKQAKDVE